ncbi:MAG TPA: hypothetical protein VNG51_19800 [Ktedonobacteraceae bacterium]|nr:hypothetical protein [Ktedonobacteraceae bacterium]
MPGKWDTSTKRLVNTRPEDFIRWLIPGAQFTGTVEAKSLNLNNREIEADNLHQMTVNGIACMIHIEFQSYADEHMAERMWEYNAMATWTYHRPTDSFVIYLKRCKVSEPFFGWKFPPAKTVHTFHFNVIKLWEVPFEDIQQAGLLGLLPLIMLARGGKNRKVVEKAITTIETVEDGDARDLLSLTYIFASLAFVKATDRQWLKRRFGMFEDALKDSWAYQEIWQEGKQEGKQEGLQEGLQQGIQQERLANLQRQRNMLEYLVQKDFPALIEMAKERGNAPNEPDVVQDIIFKLLRAETEAEARQILSE